MIGSNQASAGGFASDCLSGPETEHAGCHRFGDGSDRGIVVIYMPATAGSKGIEIALSPSDETNGDIASIHLSKPRIGLSLHVVAPISRLPSILGISHLDAQRYRRQRCVSPLQGLVMPTPKTQSPSSQPFHPAQPTTSSPRRPLPTSRKSPSRDPHTSDSSHDNQISASPCPFPDLRSASTVPRARRTGARSAVRERLVRHEDSMRGLRDRAPTWRRSGCGGR